MGNFTVFYPCSFLKAPKDYVLDFDDYEEVLSVSLPDKDDVFEHCQNGVGNIEFEYYGVRSISVGDLVRDDDTGEIWYNALIGWLAYDESFVLVNDLKKYTVYYPCWLNPDQEEDTSLTAPHGFVLAFEDYMEIFCLYMAKESDVFEECRKNAKSTERKLCSIMVGDLIKDEATGKIWYNGTDGWIEYDESFVLVNAQ